jgi:hypothetical protein
MNAEKFRCEVCDRTFISMEALTSHNNAKHKSNKSNKNILKSKFNKIIIYSLIVLFVFTSIFLIYGGGSLITKNSSTKLGTYDTFAKYLTEKGAIMYGTEWCSHCKNQKALFGESFQYVNYIDCDKYSASCSDAGITGYPTWIINKTKYSGEQSLEKLAKLTGYDLNNALNVNNDTFNDVLDSNVTNTNVSDVQIVTLRVLGNKYILEPATFKKDIPVKIIANINSMPGCSKAVTIPAFGVLEYVDSKDNIIMFTPTKIGTFRIACSMSMYTGTFNVE